MKACVIGSKKRSPSTMKIYEAMKESGRFSSVLFVPTEGIRIGVKKRKFPIFYREIDLMSFDAVVPRIGASKAMFGYLITKYLTWAGVYVPMRPESILIAHDKYLTLEVLNRAKIPVPETYLTMSPPCAKRVVSEMKPPIVMKLLGGSGGKGVMFSNDEENAFSLIDTLNVLRQPLFIEKYVQNPGEDIRIFVIGKNVVASMKRKAKKGGKRSNLASGGKGIQYKIDSTLERIAIRSAKAIGTEICGVDLIEGSKGPLVVEMNISPGMKIANITQTKIPEMIANYVADRAEVYRPKEGIKKVSYYIEKELAKIPKWFLEALEE
jgi:ribosomal protein S6--L-glutamate ligase